MIVYVYYLFLFCTILPIYAFGPCSRLLFSRGFMRFTSGHSSSNSILKNRKIFPVMTFGASHGMDECDYVEDDLEDISESNTNKNE